MRNLRIQEGDRKLSAQVNIGDEPNVDADVGEEFYDDFDDDNDLDYDIVDEPEDDIVDLPNVRNVICMMILMTNRRWP